MPSSDENHLTHHQRHEHLSSAFGTDTFGRAAERFARFFGTPKFIMGQTIIVLLWIGLNATAFIHHWDPYPFILLNLMFSTQAAYAAPLILLAQTRQADRDKCLSEADAKHREEIAKLQSAELAHNTALTQSIETLTLEIHDHITKEEGRWRSDRSP
jgi:uncharacterized membrane protein